MANIRINSFRINLERTHDQVHFQLGRLAFFIENTQYRPKNGILEVWREAPESPMQYFIFGKRIWWERLALAELYAY